MKQENRIQQNQSRARQGRNQESRAHQGKKKFGKYRTDTNELKCIRIHINTKPKSSS